MEKDAISQEKPPQNTSKLDLFKRLDKKINSNINVIRELMRYYTYEEIISILEEWKETNIALSKSTEEKEVCGYQAEILLSHILIFKFYYNKQHIMLYPIVKISHKLCNSMLN